MEKALITSLSNPIVKQARALRQKKARSETGLFLVEGIHHVGEAVEAGWDISSVLYAPDLLSSNFGRDLIARLAMKAQPVSAPVMESLADKENPQGILALVHQKQAGLQVLQDVRCGVALIAPQDPGNVGTILRTMDAVNADVLFLLEGGVELYHPTVIRSSMGTLFWKPIIQASLAAFVEWAHQKGFQLIGTSAHADIDYQRLVPQSPSVLVMGNEQKGLSQEQIDLCDVTVSLPMKGRVSSLNLAVATGILLYQYYIGDTPSRSNGSLI